MKRALLVGLALGFGLALVSMPGLARAGEGHPIGVLAIYDGGTICNRTAGGSATNQPVAFNVDLPKKFTVQCDQASYFGTDVEGCDAGQCMKLAADEKITSQVSSKMAFTSYAYNWDGGAQSAPFPVTYTGGWICASCVSGSTCLCKIYARSGFE